ncbi:glycosyltransferase family 2 protein [candidate division WOR-3 bacterium]|nr:glycosyltransferase family 2 protein [candidate division WOR-3 bacterium]
MIELKDVAILIPAYEAADTLGKVLGDWLSFGAVPEQIWVVDDGSPDATGEVARRMKVNVLTHRRNLGKGAAHKTGFKAILKSGFGWVMTMDADTQHDVREAQRFLNLDPSRFDVAIGTRRHDMAGMPPDRWFVNRLTSMVLSVFGGRKPVTDSQCGFRLISAKALGKIPLRTNHFDTESELVARALHAGIRVTEVPITTLYTSPRSHINPLLDTLRFIRLCFRYLMWM